MRLFVALPVPESVRDGITAVQEELRAIVPKASLRLTKPHQFHLTLRFLGDVAEEHLPDLTRALASACAGFAPLPLRAERIGVFPHLRFPRVAWAWVHDEKDHLLEMQRRIEAAVATFASHAEETSFTGHVTLARLNAIKRPQAEALAAFAHRLVDRQFGEWTAGEVHLMKSELSPSGARHTIASAIPLAG